MTPPPFSPGTKLGAKGDWNQNFLFLVWFWKFFLQVCSCEVVNPKFRLNFCDPPFSLVTKLGVKRGWNWNFLFLVRFWKFILQVCSCQVAFPKWVKSPPKAACVKNHSQSTMGCMCPEQLTIHIGPKMYRIPHVAVVSCCARRSFLFRLEIRGQKGAKNC